MKNVIKTHKIKLNSLDFSKELIVLRNKENSITSLDEVVKLLNDSTRKMDDYIATNNGNIKEIVFDYVANEIKAFTILNSKYSYKFETIEHYSSFNEKFNKLIDYINDYDIFISNFFDEVFDIKLQDIFTGCVCKHILATNKLDGATLDFKIDLYNNVYKELVETHASTESIKNIEKFKK